MKCYICHLDLSYFLDGKYILKGLKVSDVGLLCRKAIYDDAFKLVPVKVCTLSQKEYHNLK